MRVTKQRIFLAIALVFVIVNIVFVYKDEEGKVDRVSYIKNWTEVNERDMYEKLSTEGVLDYAEEFPVYFDDSLGSFQEFLIEEGAAISAGDDLYTYQVYNYYEMKLQLEHEADRLEKEIDALEDAISKMKSKNIHESSTTILNPDNSKAATIPQNTSGAEMMKEQYIIEKEKELGQFEAQLESVENQISDLMAGEDIITVESPYDGKVTKISKGLTNPIITVESQELYVVGELSEKERMRVEEGMPADIELVEQDFKVTEIFSGMVNEVSEEPKRVTLKGTSIYPFHAVFDEEEIDFDVLEDLLQGYHASMDITLEESLDATAVPEDAIFGPAIWRMMPSGKLVKENIEKGIHEGRFIELREEDIVPGNWVAVQKESKFHNQATFITPLKPSKASWKQIYNDAPRKRSVLIGLLAR